MIVTAGQLRAYVSEEHFDRTTRIILAALGITAALFLVLRLRLAFYPVPLNYNEGWNAYHALRFLQTGSPYPPRGGLVVNNYPPIWFAVVAGVGAFTDSLVSAGRIVATGGLFLVFATAAGIGATLRGPKGAIATVSTVAFVLTTQAAPYVGIADPQLLAQGVSLFAAYLCVRASSTNDTRYYLAIAVAVFAGFIKHNLAALPLALVLASIPVGRVAFMKCALTAVVALVVGYGVCVLIGGPTWPLNLLSARGYLPGHMVNASIAFLTLNVMGLSLGILGLSTLSNNHIRRVLAAWLALALPIAIGFSGGDGVGMNVFFDAMIAMAITASLVAGDFTRAVSSSEPVSLRLPRWAGAVALALWLTASGSLHVRDVVFEGRHAESLSVQSAKYRLDVEKLRALPGSAICDDLTLCYLAGKAFMYDPFNGSEAVNTGAIPAKMVSDLLRNSVQVLHVDNSAPFAYQLPTMFAGEVSTQFVEKSRNANGAFLVKRNPPEVLHASGMIGMLQ